MFSPIGSVRCGTWQARNNVGQTVREQGTMQARILDKVAADNVAGYEEVSQMFGKYYEYCRENHKNITDIECRLIEGWRCKPCGSFYCREIYNAHEEGEDVSGNYTDKNRNNADKSTSKNSGQNGHKSGQT